MTRLRIDSTPTFRTSVPTPAAEPRTAPSRKAVPEIVKKLRTDGFDRTAKEAEGAKSGARAKGTDKTKGADKAKAADKAKGAEKTKGTEKSRPLSKALESIKGNLDEIAQKVAADKTLDSKKKLNDAIRDELLKLKEPFNLSDRDLRDAFREVRKLAHGYTNSDPDFGATGGIREK
jgi:hypothetical protein